MDSSQAFSLEKELHSIGIKGSFFENRFQSIRIQKTHRLCLISFYRVRTQKKLMGIHFVYIWVLDCITDANDASAVNAAIGDQQTSQVKDFEVVKSTLILWAQEAIWKLSDICDINKKPIFQGRKTTFSRALRTIWKKEDGISK